MAHTQAIDEAAPANTDSASGGAAEFRNLKRDVRERQELEHYWNDATTGDQEDGKHINITQVGTGIIANKELIKSTGYSLTGSSTQPAISQAGTWNTSGAPVFWDASITNTASGTGARFVRWRVGGVEKFAVDRDGDITTLRGVSYAFPSSQGAASTVLTNNGSGTLTWGTAASPTVLAKTADYTVAASDGANVLILATSSSGNVTITLYAASGNSGKVVQVKKLVAANSVIIDGNSSETIDGATTQTITAQYTSLSLVCDGSNWHIY